MRLRTALASAALTGLALTSLTGCGSEQAGEPSGSGSPSISSATPSESATPEDQSAGDALDKTSFVDAMTAAQMKAKSAHVSMKISGAASITATGDVAYAGDSPLMRMVMSMPQMGAGKMEMRFVDKILYMTIPNVTPPGKFLKIDPSDPNNPISKQMGNLSEQLDPLASVKAMKKAIRDVELVGTQKVDGVDTDHYKVTLDTAQMTKTLGQNAASLPDELTYDMWLDGDHLLRKMTFDIAGASTVMTMTDWGKKVSVSAPPAGKVVDPAQLQQSAG